MSGELVLVTGGIIQGFDICRRVGVQPVRLVLVARRLRADRRWFEKCDAHECDRNGGGVANHDRRW